MTPSEVQWFDQWFRYFQHELKELKEGQKQMAVNVAALTAATQKLSTDVTTLEAAASDAQLAVDAATSNLTTLDGSVVAAIGTLPPTTP
jgi:D-alanyl-D-alanine carboxypeptidase